MDHRPASLPCSTSLPRRRPAWLALALALTVPTLALAGNGWQPLGPALINNGQAWPGRVPVTGRVTVITYNPQNPLDDIWVGSASGGAWRGGLLGGPHWQPMTDDAPSLAIGAIALDSCTSVRCATVWVGTGENAIRRDTQYGKGVLKGVWSDAENRYLWSSSGQDVFSYGAITRLLLDPSTADGEQKVLYAALSSGETANATHSTVTTQPLGPMGIWKSKDGGASWQLKLAVNHPATDLEMDPQDPQVLWAGFGNLGVYRSTDGGENWTFTSSGIATEAKYSNWIELAVYRSAEMPQARLYTVLGECPHPHEKRDKVVGFCSPGVYRSDDGANSWQQVAAPTPQKDLDASDYGWPLTAYVSYTHLLEIHPSNPDELWYGGVALYHSTTGGAFWSAVGKSSLHPDQHAMAMIPWSGSPSGVLAYDGNDGGFYVGDGLDQWFGNQQKGLAITQFQSVSALQKEDLLFGGTQDNGTNMFLGSEVWEHADDGDAASTLIDADDPGILYDIYVGLTPSKCTKPDFCPFGWPSINGAQGDPDRLVDNEHASWYPPMIQTEVFGGNHAIFIADRIPHFTLNDGSPWFAKAPNYPLSSDPIAALAGIKNPISAMAAAPSNQSRLYIGYYNGEIYTTDDYWVPFPLWTEVHSGLPARPVTALAVHPENENLVFAAFSGLGSHSLYRSANAGQSWSPYDVSDDGHMASEPVNAIAIETVSPFAMWAGTDAGVYHRADPGVNFAIWQKDPTLPNVGVYDFEVDGSSIYAGTHGRGVWVTEGAISLWWPDFYEEACCGYFDPYVPAPFIGLQAALLPPNERCTLQLYAAGRLCSESAVDAEGAALATDEHGFLVSDLPGFGRRSVAWGCKDGGCAGGVDLDRCAVDEAAVSCGEETARMMLRHSEETHDPASTQLGLEPGADGGTLTLTPRLLPAAGPSVALCAVRIGTERGESPERIFDHLATAIRDDVSCQRSGVAAVVSGADKAGEHEDDTGAPWRLALSAPEQAGTLLVGEVTLEGVGAVRLDAFRQRGGRALPRLGLAGEARGGEVRITETSPLGTCTQVLTTSPGESGERLAGRIAAAFLARPREGFALTPSCSAGDNPRDVIQVGSGLSFGFAHGLAVESTDPGLALTLGPAR